MTQQDALMSNFSDAPVTDSGPVATAAQTTNQPLDMGVLPSNNYPQPPSIFPTPANTQSAPTSSSSSSSDPQQQQQQHGEHAPARKRTRATPEQLAVLEKTFSVNPSPNNRIREQLSRELGMSERSIQIWFQNRRAKVKNLAKRSSLLHDETVRMQYYAASAAAAACQAAAYHYQQVAPDGSVTTNPDLYYYYYYYYYNQQQQQQQQRRQAGWPPGQLPMFTSASVPPPPSRASATGTTTAPPRPPPPPPPMAFANAAADRPYWATSMTPPPSSTTSPMSPTVSDPSQATMHRSMSGTVGGSGGGGRMRAHSLGPYTPPTRSTRHGSTDPAITATTAMPTAAAATGQFYRGRSYTSPVGQPCWPLAQQQHLYQPTIFPDANAVSNTFAAMQQQQQQQQQEVGVLHGGPPPPPLTMGPFQGMMDAERLGTPMSMDGSIDEPKLIPNRFSVEALQIGTWKRMRMHSQDLLCHYDTQRRMMVWRIQDGQQRFKMEFGLDTILHIYLEPLLERLGWARLELRLAQPEAIAFYMEDPNTSWTQCRDFTQDKQATTAQVHHLDGPALALRAELHRLAQCDAHIQSLLQQQQQQQQEYHHPQQPQQHKQDVQSIDPRYLTVAASGAGQDMQETEPSMLSLLKSKEVETDTAAAAGSAETTDGDQQDPQSLLLFQGIEPQG